MEQGTQDYNKGLLRSRDLEIASLQEQIRDLHYKEKG